MRIDATPLPVTLDRSPRQGTATTAFRQIQQDAQQAPAQQPSAPASNVSGSAVTALQMYAAQGASSTTASVYGNPAASVDQDYRPQLNNRAAQAIASYSSTAAFIADADGPQVVGLDLFA